MARPIKPRREVLRVWDTATGYTVEFGAGASIADVAAACGVTARVVKKTGKMQVSDFMKLVNDFATNPTYDEPETESPKEVTETSEPEEGKENEDGVREIHNTSD